MAREEMFKTVSFGGYDKKAVEDYIQDLKKNQLQDIADLKTTISKLSETVKNLQAMRESNSQDAKESVNNLKKYNESIEAEIDQLRQEVKEYKDKEAESSIKYESISRALLEATVRSDALIQDATQKSDSMVAEATKKSEDMLSDAEARTAAMLAKAETDREMLAVKLEEEKKLKMAETESACREMLENAEAERDSMIAKAKGDVVNVRSAMKHECENVSTYMTSLMQSVQGVVEACNETKLITDKAFKGIEAPVATEAATTLED